MRRSTPEIETTDGHIADRKTGVELCRCVAGRWVVLLRVVEQLTLLLFLKMADHLTEEPYDKPAVVPPALGWKALLPLNGAALEDKYGEILETLGLEPGMLGVIFKSAR